MHLNPNLTLPLQLHYNCRKNFLCAFGMDFWGQVAAHHPTPWGLLGGGGGGLFQGSGAVGGTFAQHAPSALLVGKCPRLIPDKSQI